MKEGDVPGGGGGSVSPESSSRGSSRKAASMSRSSNGGASDSVSPIAASVSGLPGKPSLPGAYRGGMSPIREVKKPQYISSFTNYSARQLQSTLYMQKMARGFMVRRKIRRALQEIEASKDEQNIKYTPLQVHKIHKMLD